jgi:uncharacterized protein (TIGR03083 family)
MSIPAVAVAFRDQDVRFDVTASDAVTANRAQRARLLTTLQELTAEQWQAPSRCAGWTVQDVVRHLGHMNELVLGAIAAGRADEHYTVFRNFDPKSTPSRLIADAGPEPVAETLSGFAASTTRTVTAIDDLANIHADLLIATPAGRQPWPRAVLHGLFDSALHERDILVALSLPIPHDSDAAAGTDAVELAAVASYQVLLTGRILCMVGIQTELCLNLVGGPSLRLLVAGASVDVHTDRRRSADAPSNAGPDGECMNCTGPATAVLDAMAGRANLSDVLTGPPAAAAALTVLAGVL